MPQMTAQTQAVLATLLRDPTVPLYGLEISRAIGSPGGTIYPLLARLEVAGWVESYWEKIDPVLERRRPRRYYRLTASGERAAREVLARTAERLAPFLTSPGAAST
jgi:PadR family transcriptional regulator PadR